MKFWQFLVTAGPAFFAAMWDVHRYLRDRNIARRDGGPIPSFDWACFYAHLGMGTGGGGTLLGLIQGIAEAAGRHV